MNLLELRNRLPIHELSLAEVIDLIHETRINRVRAPIKTVSAAKSSAHSTKETDLERFMKLANDLDPELLAKLMEE